MDSIKGMAIMFNLKQKIWLKYNQEFKCIKTTKGTK